jgi:hypothetical protein
VIGASLHPLQITLEAKELNAYLEHDGLPDVLAARRKANKLDRPARERYSKHVKALVQVGDRRTDGYQTAFGCPAEPIPLDNPYTVKPGGTLRVRAVVDGEPVANQLVIAGGHSAARAARTDSAGVARIRISAPGPRYVKFIHMRPAAGDSTIDYESKWGHADVRCSLRNGYIPGRLCALRAGIHVIGEPRVRRLSDAREDDGK